MRSAGSPDVLEYRRSLAVQRVAEGYSTEEAADFLGIDPSSVRRWLAAYRRYGGDGLTAQPVPGRLPKLTTTQEKIVLRWLSDPPPSTASPPTCGPLRAWSSSSSKSSTPTSTPTT